MTEAQAHRFIARWRKIMLIPRALPENDAVRKLRNDFLVVSFLFFMATPFDMNRILLRPGFYYFSVSMVAISSVLYFRLTAALSAIVNRKP
ncbi:MAG: hypothetical protein NTZ16_03895 [Verrucomicrobia bacterium]|nr:hypothetical protein [Verrucomicrobiota bacterium]